MSEQREFNAPTVDEALSRASSTIGLSSESLSYRVLDEGSSGFLGLGARDARVLVETPANEETPAPSSTVETEEPETDTQQAEPVAEKLTPPVVEKTDSTPDSGDESAALSEESLSEIRKHVENTLEAMAFESRVSARDAGETVLVEIESEDAGLLIGQKGETLDAVQYLANVSFYRNRPFSKKIVLDCGGYRERRAKAVQGMAHRAAKRVVREGKSTDLPPMSSSERRAVHSYLKDNPKVTTSSVGNDDNRKVTISPA